jgi:hypothetical protein
MRELEAKFSEAALQIGSTDLQLKNLEVFFTELNTRNMTQVNALQEQMRSFEEKFRSDALDVYSRRADPWCNDGGGREEDTRHL